MSIQSSINQNLSLAGYFALNSSALANKAKITQARQRFEKAVEVEKELHGKIKNIEKTEGIVLAGSDILKRQISEDTVNAAFSQARIANEESIAAATELRQLDPGLETISNEQAFIRNKTRLEKDITNAREAYKRGTAKMKPKSEQMRERAMQHLKDKQNEIAPERILPPEPEKITPEGIVKGEKQ